MITHDKYVKNDDNMCLGGLKEKNVTGDYFPTTVTLRGSV